MATRRTYGRARQARPTSGLVSPSTETGRNRPSGAGTGDGRRLPVTPGGTVIHNPGSRVVDSATSLDRFSHYAQSIVDPKPIRQRLTPEGRKAAIAAGLISSPKAKVVKLPGGATILQSEIDRIIATLPGMRGVTL